MDDPSKVVPPRLRLAACSIPQLSAIASTAVTASAPAQPPKYQPDARHTVFLFFYFLFSFFTKIYFRFENLQEYTGIYRNISSSHPRTEPQEHQEPDSTSDAAISSYNPTRQWSGGVRGSAPAAQARTPGHGGAGQATRGEGDSSGE